ncbi:MAG: hypothetical protein NC078_07745, partial [Ruminococcus sp.]|nr:hypothetical protein [Ruminococcus sp.]
MDDSKTNNNPETASELAFTEETELFTRPRKDINDDDDDLGEEENSREIVIFSAEEEETPDNGSDSSPAVSPVPEKAKGKMSGENPLEENAYEEE